MILKTNNPRRESIKTKSNIIIALETAINGGSISLFRNGKFIDFHTGATLVSGAEDVLPKISELLNKNDLLKSDVETIVISNGPGSFTGIRIGIATALALQKSLKCKCYGVDLLRVMAAFAGSQLNNENIISAVSHGRNKICWVNFKSEKSDANNSDINYFVTDTDILFEYTQEAADNKEKLTIIADSYLYQTIIEKQPDKSSENLSIINAGKNLSLLVGNMVLVGKLPLDKPKPLYLS